MSVLLQVEPSSAIKGTNEHGQLLFFLFKHSLAGSACSWLFLNFNIIQQLPANMTAFISMQSELLYEARNPAMSLSSNPPIGNSFEDLPDEIRVIIFEYAIYEPLITDEAQISILLPPTLAQIKTPYAWEAEMEALLLQKPQKDHSTAAIAGALMKHYAQTSSTMLALLNLNRKRGTSQWSSSRTTINSSILHASEIGLLR